MKSQSFSELFHKFMSLEGTHNISLSVKNAIKYYREGVFAINRRDYEEAVKKFDLAIQEDSTNPLIYNSKGLILQQLSNHLLALECFNKALLLDSGFVSGYHNKGVSLYALDRFDEAIAAYDKVIELDSAYIDAYYNKALILDRLGKYNAAIELYTQVIVAEPLFNGACYNKGQCLYELGKYQEAINAYDQEIMIDCNYIEAYLGKIRSLYQLKNFEEAVDCCYKLIKIDPKNEIATGLIPLLTKETDSIKLVKLASTNEINEMTMGHKENTHNSEEEISKKKAQGDNQKVIVVTKLKYDNSLLNKQKVLEAFKAKHGSAKLNHLITLTDDLVNDQASAEHLSSNLSNKDTVTHIKDLETVRFNQELKDILNNTTTVEDTLSAIEFLMGLTPDCS